MMVVLIADQKGLMTVIWMDWMILMVGWMA